MTGGAEGLPIGLIPEQCLVTPVRCDVVHHGGLRPAAGAARLAPEKRLAGFLPCASVAALAGIRPGLVEPGFPLGIPFLLTGAANAMSNATSA